jgi:hypothetical protein
VDKHPPLRLRRTLDPAAPGRALWGVSRRAAAQAIRQQEHEFAAAQQELDGQIASAETDVQRLTAELELQQRRLDSLRHVVSVLREKLAHERAARAVLAARLSGQQADAQREEQTAGTIRLETARLSADIAQEEEALKQLVAALYRSVSGRGGAPAGLEVLAELPPPPPGARLSGPRQVAPWQRLLAGKKAGRTLKTPDGRIILNEGETIGPEDISAAEREGLLFELILTMRTPEKIPDL